MISKRFLQWWLFFIVQGVIIGGALGIGGYDFLLENDITYISFILIVFWAMVSLVIGLKIFHNKEITESIWFAAESCMTMGMIGTVIGFIYMLTNNFADIDPNNIEVMKRVISDMAQGMGTALLTTLCGLITSLFLKIQIINAEADH